MFCIWVCCSSHSILFSSEPLDLNFFKGFFFCFLADEGGFASVVPSSSLATWGGATLRTSFGGPRTFGECSSNSRVDSEDSVPLSLFFSVMLNGIGTGPKIEETDCQSLKI